MATHIGNLVHTFLKAEQAKRKDQETIQRVIEAIFSRQLAKYARVGRIHQGMCVIYCEASSLLYEFNLKKKELLEAAQKELPAIKDIKFKIG